jgi:hypothetical protein
MPTDTGIDDANRFVAQKHQDRILNALCRFSLSTSNSGCQKLENLPEVLYVRAGGTGGRLIVLTKWGSHTWCTGGWICDLHSIAEGKAKIFCSIFSIKVRAAGSLSGWDELTSPTELIRTLVSWQLFLFSILLIGGLWPLEYRF